jgi:hypothetical protein
MTWTKLSDDYSDDCWTLSDAAFRLHTEALVWSNRKLLECVIPKDDLVRFSRCPNAAEELVAFGWWTETAKTYVLRHHAGYQRTREQVVHQQKINSENGSKGGRPRTRPSSPREVFKPHEETESITETPSETGTDGDRTGQDSLEGEQETGRIDCACGKLLSTVVQQRRGMCNRCYVVANAERTQHLEGDFVTPAPTFDTTNAVAASARPHAAENR